MAIVWRAKEGLEVGYLGGVVGGPLRAAKGFLLGVTARVTVPGQRPYGSRRPPPPGHGLEAPQATTFSTEEPAETRAFLRSDSRFWFGRDV